MWQVLEMWTLCCLHALYLPPWRNSAQHRKGFYVQPLAYKRQCPALGTGAPAQIPTAVGTRTLSFCSCISARRAGPSPWTSWAARKATGQQTLLHGSWDPWSQPPSGGSTSKHRKKFLWGKLNALAQNRAVHFSFFLTFYNVFNKTALTSNHKRDMFHMFQNLKKLS